MSRVRFATLCDSCGARSIEYSGWPLCFSCGADTCPSCFAAGTAVIEGDGQPDTCLCTECGVEGGSSAPERNWN